MSIKAELYRILKSSKSRIFIFLIFLVPVVDILLNFQQNVVPHLHEEGDFSVFLYHPSEAAFLSGASHGHITQMLLIWLMPIYILLIYGDSYIWEKSCGYTGIIFSQYSRKKIVQTKFAVSFLLFFSIIFLSLLLNFLLANLLFMGGSDFKGMELMLAEGDLSGWWAWSLENPFLAYFLYMILYSILAGIFGVVCYAVCYLAPSYKLAYTICFFLWFGQIVSPYSITYAIQPFIEYGPEYFLPALLIFFVIAFAIVVFSRWHEVRCDEY